MGAHGIRTAVVAVVALAVLAPVATACGSSSSGSPADAGTEVTASASATGSTGSTAATAGSIAPAVGAAWQTEEIVDIDGATFTLADFVGRPVFVENFATWCPTCRAQLGRTQEAAAAMGDDAVFVVLSVETDLSSEDVAEYAEDNGFSSMRFAVMSPELLAAFADAFGTSAVNPPSTPHVVIAADGTAGELETGSVSPSEIQQALRAVS